MKKIIIAMAAMAAAFTMASCNKEQPVSPNENPTVSKSVITASINNDLTKTYLQGNDTDGYKVLWSEGDGLFVGEIDEYYDFNWTAEYTLENSSVGRSKGTFSWEEGGYFDSEDKERYPAPVFEGGMNYIAAYPFDLVEENNFEYLIWKTEQTYNTKERYIPMYSEIKCMEDGTANFEFSNLGGLLRLTVKGTAIIKSIKISAAEDEEMSGSFLLSEDGDGNTIALIGFELGDVLNYINLDCGVDGVALTDTGTDFYFSVPCHMKSKRENIGYSDVTITLTDIDGKTCVKKLSSDKKLVIERSKITTASFTASEFKANIPEGALPGKFTINEDGDQVYFSQGNLYWDGDSFEFETNQYDYPTTWSASHVSHFFWSKSADVAISETYSDPYAQDDDVFFTNETENTAKADFTVIGVTGKYRTLSHDEWKYLIEDRTVNGSKGEDYSYSHAIYGDILGMILYPDDYQGPVISGTVSTLPTGCVFLPAAGYRGKSEENSTQLFEIGVAGTYNSSTYEAEYMAAYMLLFYYEYDELLVSADANDKRDSEPMSSRLVTDCE